MKATKNKFIFSNVLLWGLILLLTGFIPDKQKCQVLIIEELGPVASNYRQDWDNLLTEAGNKVRIGAQCKAEFHSIAAYCHAA